MDIIPIPKGDVSREAIDALRGYVYQIYQSALAWIELEADELLFLEVAEDYTVVAGNALKGVQVKETGHSVTINSDDIIASIDSFVDLRQRNPELQVELRHLTTSMIGKEKSVAHRIGDTPTLETWRKLARAGDVEPLRKILDASKLSKQTKNYIRKLDDTGFREEFLKRIHFDCGALDSKFLGRQLRSKLLKIVMERGGVNSQVDGCLNSILITLLQKATQKEERFVDINALEELLERATQIPVNRSQFEAQNQLINKALAASVPQATNLVATRLSEHRPIDEVPFPAAIASRTVQIDNIVSSLTQYGVSWIYGAAGIGKTIGAKIAARHLGGNWVGINLRGLNAEQVDAVLSGAIDRLTEQKLDGFLIDDLECSFEPHIVDKLFYLRAVCNRTDLLLLCTSPRPLSPDFLFSANLPASIEQKLEEFSEHDIQEILAGLDVHDANWAKYIHVISGGGHPQLAIAAIQSMQNSGWDKNEFRTLDSLLVGNPVIEQVRARTRERLLNELPEGGRRLLERLSLKSGSFRRSFVLDMAQVTPTVTDAGIVFERLIGSWVDQQQIDRFALSPLLSDYAAKTLTDEQKREINFEIANSLIKRRKLDPTEANSALLAAWSGKNIQVIVRLCIAVLGTDQNDLEMISPHLMMFTLMRTDTFAYEDDPAVSQMFRGAQLILLCQEENSRDRIQEVLDRFEAESAHVEHEGMRTSMALMVYAKLLLSTPKFGALPNFWDLVHKLDVLLENQERHLPPELLGEVIAQEMDGVPVVGFMFLNQVRQIKLINELLPAFGFLNSCGQELRQKLLKLFSNPDFDVDMLVMGAWLKEHEANTIDPPSHSEVFARLEEFAKSWGHTDLAVCCRKYRAIIIDEYGDDKDQAMAVLDAGLELYGETNSELVRAKAKVLYRAEDHQGSLELSRVLIDGDAPLSETEKAFLGRDAAISAEKQGDYETARRYYLYGSNAAGNCSIPNMAPMRVGLMADAALASWHAGDHETCLRDFVSVLHELKDIDPKSSLRAAHCHAICRHVLLWIDQDASGEKHLLADGEETKIYPGVVSNPEPHSEIGKRYITPIEMAWYMLAAIENHSCLDLGITQKLVTFLPKGPVLEGQFLLTSSKMRKAFTLLDIELFLAALRETVAEFAYVKEQGDYKNSFDIENVTYGSFPLPTLEQQAGIADLTEQFVLCFVSNCIFVGRVAQVDQLVDALEEGQGVKFRKELLDSLRGSGFTTDYNTSVAALLAIHRNAINKNETLSPAQVFELAFKALQVADLTNNIRVMAKYAFEWLNEKWTFIWERQQFLLKSPAFYEKSISQVHISEGDSWIGKLINLLQAILPTMGFKNESQLNSILKDIREKKSRRTPMKTEV
jgi:hypothetical protein